MKNKKGLTLIELLAVIAIIAILFILLIPTVNNAIDKARYTGVLTDMRSYEIALRSLTAEKGDEPISEEELNAALDEELRFKDGVSIQKNPFGIPYFWFQDNPFIRIHTLSNHLLPQEFSIMYEYGDGEYEFIKKGFDDVYIGVPYCDSPINSNEDYEYQICNNHATILNYIGTKTDVVIPPKIDGHKVIAIGHSSSNPNSKDYLKAFENKGITSVVLPDTIKILGNDAFYENKITSVDIPDSIVRMADYAFSRNQITSVTIPPSIHTLERSVFKHNKITSVTIPSTIKKIEKYAFHDNQLTSLSIPDSVDELGIYSFAYNDINNLTISKNLTSLGDYAFYANYLVDVTIPPSVKSIGVETFAWNDLTSLRLPSSISNLGKDAFLGNFLDDVYLPATLRDIVGNGQGHFLNHYDHSKTSPTLHFE